MTTTITAIITTTTTTTTATTTTTKTTTTTTETTTTTTYTTTTTTVLYTLYCFTECAELEALEQIAFHLCPHGFHGFTWDEVSDCEEPTHLFLATYIHFFAIERREKN